MKSHALWVSALLVASLGLWYSAASHAAVTADHRKQIDEVKKELAKVKGLITKKDYDDAEKILGDADSKLKQIAKEAGLEDGNKLLAPLYKTIEQSRETLARKPGKAGAGGAATAGAFERDVAPILAARCLNCHGTDNPRGNLSLETFARMEQGGDSGQLLVPGKPATSLIIQRISATDATRMPKMGNALSADEIGKISAWITSGAKFGGKKTTPLGDLKSPEEAKAAATPIQINKATGSETVSFTKDIAPFMSNLCVNCHSGNNPRSGFSLETFEKLMKGGKSGRVVLPGNTKDSRLWHLVGEQDPIKMPPGQALITRTNHSNLRTWIEEGAKFDGGDPKTPLRSLVPTAAEKEAKVLAAMSSDEFAKRRKTQASELWTAAFANETPAEHETDAFLLVGNVADPRLKQIGDWARADAELLKRTFKVKESLIWRGKLILFVFKDRFSYTEFAQTNERVEVPADTSGHARVTANVASAYIAMQDIGDASTEEAPGLRTQILGLLTEALLQRAATRAPDWAAKGMGLSLASRSDPKSPYFRGLKAAAHESLKAVTKPDELFANGTFSPADLAPVGFTLVSHMMNASDENHFVQFLGQLTAGTTLDAALTSVYSVDKATLAQSYQAYVDSLPGSKVPGKKPKK